MDKETLTKFAELERRIASLDKRSAWVISSFEISNSDLFEYVATGTHTHAFPKFSASCGSNITIMLVLSLDLEPNSSIDARLLFLGDEVASEQRTASGKTQVTLLKNLVSESDEPITLAFQLCGNAPFSICGYSLVVMGELLQVAEGVLAAPVSADVFDGGHAQIPTPPVQPVEPQPPLNPPCDASEVVAAVPVTYVVGTSVFLPEELEEFFQIQSVDPATTTGGDL